MERLSRLAAYVGFPGRASRAELDAAQERRRREEKAAADFKKIIDTFKRGVGLVKNILLWEDTCTSVFAVLAFNVLFWGFIVMNLRGFVAAGSAALAITITCVLSSIENPTPDDPPIPPDTRSEQYNRLIRKIELFSQGIENLQEEQPRLFRALLCCASVIIWFCANCFNSVLFSYAICMIILVGPAIILRPCKELTIKEWDSEIEEFLPAVTEDNLQVLKRAGETGDRSPTPPSPNMDTSNDQFNDEELLGLRIPSHEDGSTDGLELSELELSADDTDVDGIRFQSGHFERAWSSSDDDVDLGIEARKLDVDDDDSDDSEFEIIDRCEVDALKNF